VFADLQSINGVVVVTVADASTSNLTQSLLCCFLQILTSSVWRRGRMALNRTCIVDWRTRRLLRLQLLVTASSTDVW